MTYCYKYALLTSGNGRRKFRSLVQIPSRVLQCTSRTPSPSSSRANSPRLWLTVACPRPQRANGLYPFHSSVYTIAPGSVAGRTVASINSSAPLPDPPEPTPTAGTANRRRYRRPVGIPGAVALHLVRPPPWRVERVGVRHPFFLWGARWPTGVWPPAPFMISATPSAADRSTCIFATPHIAVWPVVAPSLPISPTSPRSRASTPTGYNRRPCDW